MHFKHERTTSNIHKIFHSLIWFFSYEMILQTFSCTIVNQIKSSEKLVVKLKIRNLQLLQMKTILKLFLGRVPLFSSGNKWATVSPPPAVYHPLTIRLNTEFVWFSSQIFNRLSTKSSTEWFDYLKRDPYLSISWGRHVNHIHSWTIHVNIGTLHRRAFMREACTVILVRNLK